MPLPYMSMNLDRVQPDKEAPPNGPKLHLKGKRLVVIGATAADTLVLSAFVAIFGGTVVRFKPWKPFRPTKLDAHYIVCGPIPNHYEALIDIYENNSDAWLPMLNQALREHAPIRERDGTTTHRDMRFEKRPVPISVATLIKAAMEGVFPLKGTIEARYFEMEERRNAPLTEEDAAMRRAHEYHRQQRIDRVKKAEEERAQKRAKTISQMTGRPLPVPIPDLPTLAPRERVTMDSIFGEGARIRIAQTKIEPSRPPRALQSPLKPPFVLTDDSPAELGWGEYLRRKEFLADWMSRGPYGLYKEDDPRAQTDEECSLRRQRLVLREKPEWAVRAMRPRFLAERREEEYDSDDMSICSYDSDDSDYSPPPAKIKRDIRRRGAELDSKVSLADLRQYPRAPLPWRARNRHGYRWPNEADREAIGSDFVTICTWVSVTFALSCLLSNVVVRMAFAVVVGVIAVHNCFGWQLLEEEIDMGLLRDLD